MKSKYKPIFSTFEHVSDFSKNKKFKVAKLTSCSGQSQSHIFQELNKLKKWNIVNFEKQELGCYYYSTDKNICNIIQSFNLLPENKEYL